MLSAAPPVRTHRLLVAVVVLATIAYYFWTAVCSFDQVPEIRPKGHPETDHFNLLSRGFLNGHLHLAGEVPQGLKDAPNPYDPSTRKNVEVLHDASYYRGKYYIYFGPGPVVALLLPFSVLTGRDLPLPYGVWLFTSLGYLALVGVFLAVQRRYYPRASAWTLLAALAGLGGAGMLVALLRRPHIWEFPASSGFCFFAVSLLCLARALFSPHATRWALLGGLSLGMAVASRPTYIVCSVIFALPLLSRAGPSYSWRALLAAAAGCSSIVLGLLVYNYARFGEPFEFGQKYQLSAIIEGDARHFSLSYAAFNLRVYFLSLLRWTSTFPFHDGIVVPAFPPGHGGYEFSFGLLTNLPFSLFGVAGLASLFRRESAGGGDTVRRTIVAAVATCALLKAGLLACYFGCCIRYMADFAPCLMLLAGIGLLSWEAALRHRFARVALRVVAIGLALFSTFAAAASVVLLYTPQREVAPLAYRPIARVLNFPTYSLRQHAWPDYGPIELELSFPPEPRERHEVLLTLHRDNRATATVFIEYLGGDRLRFGYRESEPSSEVFSAAVTRSTKRPQLLRLNIGGNYARYDGHKAWLHAEFDGLPVWDLPAVSLRAFPAKIVVGEHAERKFSGQLHAVRRLRVAEFARLDWGGARVRLTLTPAMEGRSFPLMTTGRTNAGDLLFMRVVGPGKVVFGYDHWAAPLDLSPEIDLPAGPEHVLEFWVPALAKEVHVKVGGKTVWRHAAPAFPAGPDAIFIGSNPIGGSTCETLLENGVVEARGLPPPPPGSDDRSSF